MVVSFEFCNVFSFREKQKISFEPEGLKELKHHLHTPYSVSTKDELLKSLALYGHNSYGKSNFIKTLLFFRDFILSSFTQPNQVKNVPFLLNNYSHSEPSYFEIVLFRNDVKYRYGFEIKDDIIISEWLYYSTPGVRENYIFQRVEQEFLISKTWNKENGNKIEIQAIPFAKPHVLFFSVLISQELTLIEEIAEKISNIIIIKKLDEDIINKAVSIFSNSKYQKLISRFLENADLGFETIFDKIERQLKNKPHERGVLNILYEEEIKRFELYTAHDIYDKKFVKVDSVKFDLFKDESDGSIKFFILTSLLAYAIINEIFICIDEIDSKLHPDLLLLLINEYHKGNINSSGAQLIFSTHNTVLLSRQMRRDQFVVLEKNKFGESSINKIHTKESPIRIDTSLEKEYRKGRLGGVSKKVIQNNNQGSLFD